MNAKRASTFVTVTTLPARPVSEAPRKLIPVKAKITITATTLETNPTSRPQKPKPTASRKRVKNEPKPTAYRLQATKWAYHDIQPERNPEG